MQCLQTNCTPADQQAAMGLQAALCAPYTNTKPVSSVAYAGMTSTASTVAPTSSAGAAAASSVPSASATKSSNAGSAVKVGYGSIFAVAVGAAGMLA
ncbi:hypothetical protein FRC05_001862 [Tulasnella sp. 425]|nr:hypothetical protein FRC05_001862 [Tulasnella sp. 425]